MLHCAISDININKYDSTQMHVLEMECARYEKVSAKSRDSVSCTLPSLRQPGRNLTTSWR